MKRLLIAVLLVGLCAVPAVFAGDADDLVKAIEQQPTLFTGQCNVASLGIESKPCCIHANPAKANSGWIIIYHEVDGKPTHILFVEDKKEQLLWSRGSV